MGTEPQPNMERYCSIRVLEYSIQAFILQVTKIEVVKTKEVRDSNIMRYYLYPDFALRDELDEELIHTIADKIQKLIQQNGNTKVGNPQIWKTDENFAIKAEKENRNAGYAGRGRPNLPSGQDRFADPDIVSKLFFAEEDNHTQAPRWASNHDHST